MLQWLVVTLSSHSLRLWEIPNNSKAQLSGSVSINVVCGMCMKNDEAGNDLDSNGDIILCLFKLLCERQTFPLPHHQSCDWNSGCLKPNIRLSSLYPDVNLSTSWFTGSEKRHPPLLNMWMKFLLWQIQLDEKLNLLS